MKDYIVINGQASLHSGKVKLSPSQVKDRAHNLKVIDVKKGLFEIIQTINFKKGEEFSYDGPVNKAQLEELGEVVDLKSKKATEDKGKKKAKELAEANIRYEDSLQKLEEAETKLTTAIEYAEGVDSSLSLAHSEISGLETQLEAEKARADEAEAKLDELEAAVVDAGGSVVRDEEVDGGKLSVETSKDKKTPKGKKEKQP